MVSMIRQEIICAIKERHKTASLSETDIQYLLQEADTVIKLQAQNNRDTITSKAAIDKFIELQREEQLKKIDRRLFNTKLLLKNYRHLKVYCEEIANTEVGDEEEVDTLYEMEKDYLTLETIKKSEARTIALMQFVDNMLAVYKLNCERLGQEAVRKYDTLMHFYIHEDKLTYAQIAELHYVTERTAQRDLKAAMHDMSVLFFGADGIRIQL